MGRSLSSRRDDGISFAKRKVVLATNVACDTVCGAMSANARMQSEVRRPHSTHTSMDLRPFLSVALLVAVVRPTTGIAIGAAVVALIATRPWRVRGGRDHRRWAPASRVDASFADGWQYLQREDFVEAERAFRFVLGTRPENADASLYLGIALAGQGSHADAIAPLRDAADARPLDAEVHWRLGISLRETGELFLAMSSLREALQLRPGLYEVEAALDDLVSAAARSATRTSPVRARSPRRAGRRRLHRYIRRTMPASSQELRVGA